MQVMPCTRLLHASIDRGADFSGPKNDHIPEVVELRYRIDSHDIPVKLIKIGKILQRHTLPHTVTWNSLHRF